MIEMTKEEFQTVYDALAASVGIDSDEGTVIINVMDAQDEAFKILKEVKNRPPGSLRVVMYYPQQYPDLTSEPGS